MAFLTQLSRRQMSSKPNTRRNSVSQSKTSKMTSLKARFTTSMLTWNSSWKHACTFCRKSLTKRSEMHDRTAWDTSAKSATMDRRKSTQRSTQMQCRWSANIVGATCQWSRRRISWAKKTKIDASKPLRASRGPSSSSTHTWFLPISSVKVSFQPTSVPPRRSW